MKKKTEKSEKKKSPPLPAATPFGNATERLTWQVRKGKLTGESRIAFYFLLPRFLTPEGEGANALLEETEKAFFSYLIKQSALPREVTLFAGLQATLQGGELTLSYAFSPFDERSYRPVGRLLLTQEGELLEVILL